MFGAVKIIKSMFTGSVQSFVLYEGERLPKKVICEVFFLLISQFAYVHYTHTHISLAFYFWDIGKQ